MNSVFNCKRKENEYWGLDDPLESEGDASDDEIRDEEDDVDVKTV